MPWGNMPKNIQKAGYKQDTEAFKRVKRSSIGRVENCITYEERCEVFMVKFKICRTVKVDTKCF